jgi:hypothetical protein
MTYANKDQRAMQSKPGKTLVFLKEEAAPDNLILTFSFWSAKESSRIVKKSQLCQHPDA